MANIPLPKASGAAPTTQVATAFPPNMVPLDVSAEDAEFERPVQVVSTGTGDVVVVPWGGSEAETTETYAADGTGLLPGQAIPYMISKVISSGTTSTKLRACYV
jgi:hypothetical protein